jgi:hypothetical protein
VSGDFLPPQYTGGRAGRRSEISRGGSLHPRHISTALLPLVSTATCISGARLSRVAWRTMVLMFTVTDVKCRPSVIRHSQSSPLWSGTMKGKGPVWIRQVMRGALAVRPSIAFNSFPFTHPRCRPIRHHGGARRSFEPPPRRGSGVPASARGAVKRSDCSSQLAERLGPV